MGHKGKKLSNRSKRYKSTVKQRTQTTTPTIYTKHLKTNKHKKLKSVSSNAADYRCFDKPPRNDEDDYVPASFKEMLLLKQGKVKRLNQACGDVEGMKKKVDENPLPKQGKFESDAHYIGRVRKEAEDELNRIAFRKNQGTQLVTGAIPRSKKKQKSTKRLKEKRKMKRFITLEKSRNGFEHLKDHVKFNEVITEPPKHLTKPKLVFGKKHNQIHSLDRLLAT